MANGHETEIYVRFSETDAMGHVNNTSHFLYFEEARTKFFSVLYPERDDSSSFILASIKCDYLEQAFADRTLKVVTAVSRVGKKSFTLVHHLIDKVSNARIAEAEAVTVCFNFIEQKTIPVNEELRRKLELHLFEKEKDMVQ